jgi:hypothetical protein
MTRPPDNTPTHIPTLVGLGGLLFAMVCTPRLHAHGRLPDGSTIALSPTVPGASRALVLQVQEFPGVVLSDDGGTTWSWLCRDALGLDNETAVPLLLKNNKRLLVGTANGLRRSRLGCQSSAVSGDIAGRNITDMAQTKDGVLLALSAVGVAADRFDVRLWQSDPQKPDWRLVTRIVPDNFLPTSLSRSEDGSRIYLAGRDGQEKDQANGYRGVLLRSDDGGANWQRSTVPGSNGSNTLPYVLASDPQQASRVYLANVRTEQQKPVSFELRISEDSGSSWLVAAELAKPVTAFALSPDGSHIAFGGALSGLWRGDRESLGFEQVHPLKLRCLAWADEGLYACGNPSVDPFALGLSTDGGRTFAPLLQTTKVCGVARCEEPAAAAPCEAAWLSATANLPKELRCPAASAPAGTKHGSCSAAPPGQRGAKSQLLFLLSMVLFGARRQHAGNRLALGSKQRLPTTQQP